MEAFVEFNFMEAYVEAFVEVNAMEAFMQAFVEIMKASVKKTFTGALFESFVQAFVGELVTDFSMESFVNDFGEVTFCKLPWKLWWTRSRKLLPLNLSR